MKKLPYGISNYEELVEDNYYYVDKTRYIEHLEELAEKRIMFLRPRKFGKTLFTSVLENYYDIKKIGKFEKLYGETYIGKNPTRLKNSYHILRFNFSGIDKSDEKSIIRGFRNEVVSSIEVFVKKYDMDFIVNFEDEAENVLNNLFKAFGMQKENEKIYVIIDEYDHFANELLSFNTSKFKELVSRNGKIRKWYEILKKGTESVVDRIFITGVAPITLDSMTSGFNICLDKTRDREFNEMLGFTKEEIIELMNVQNISQEEQEKLLPIMKKYYDGYKFSLKATTKIYNSNMSLYFLNEYSKYKEFPEEMIDMNIASDYSKLSNMLMLCQGEKNYEIVEKTVSGEGIVSEIVGKFNPEMGFGDKELVSMLFYLGYLTIVEERFGRVELNIPNLIMKELYAEYFIEVMEQQLEFKVSGKEYEEIEEEIALEGKIDKITELLHKYLNNLSNRDFQNFDEKYVKLIFYCIAMNLKVYDVKSEMEIKRKYPDLLLEPKDKTKGYNSVMVEFKYLKRGEEEKLKETQSKAKEQIKEYSEFEEMKKIENLKKYTVVAVVDKIYIENIQ